MENKVVEDCCANKECATAKELFNSDEKVIYGQCECHIGDGFVICCDECKNVKPDCFTRAEHNKTL